MNTIFTSLDLELNQPSQKIIAIGAIVGDISTGEVKRRWHSFVNPNETLSPFITELTKIKQQDVDGAPSLEEAYAQIKEIHIQSFINPITWGGGDSQAIYQQLGEPVNWCFGRRWIDVKTLFVSWRLSQGQPIQGGLAKSMLKLGIKFEGQKHNAEDDAYNTFRMYTQMLKKFRE